MKRPAKAEAIAAAALAGLVLIPAARAADSVAPPEAAEKAEILHRFSASQRFAARGPDPNAIVPFLAWVEDVASRVERALGESLPAARGYPMVFTLGNDPAMAGAPVRRIVRTGGSGLGQRIEIPDIDSADPAEVLASTVSMFVARYVAARQSAEARSRTPATAPDWFSFGLAGSLYPTPRSAFQRQTLERWSRGEDDPIPAMLAPVDDHARALSMLPQWTTWMAWLQSYPAFQIWANRWIRAWSAGHSLTIEELAATVDPSWTAGNLARQWDVAVASIQKLDSPRWITEPMLIERLRRVLARPVAMIPFAMPEDVADPVTMETLLEKRGESWSPLLARIMLAETVGLPAGGAPRIEAIAGEFAGILSLLTNPPPSGFAGPIRRRIGAWRLSRRLADAERRLDDLEAFVHATGELTDPEGPPVRDPASAAADDSKALELEAERAMFHDAFRSPPPR